MKEQQTTTVITVPELLETVRRMRQQGARLAQICCTEIDGFELDYSFDIQQQYYNWRVIVPNIEVPVPSITGIYPAAFTYENEIKDLFGIAISGIALDYAGKFYTTMAKIPFNSRLTILIKDVDKETGTRSAQTKDTP